MKIQGRSTVFLALIFLLLVLASCTLHYLPWIMLWLYAGMSVLTCILYGIDKLAARRGMRRTPENTLHLLALLGGWPGAILAQHLFRHKTSKKSFRLVFWITVLLNAAAFAWLHTATGNARLYSLLGPFQL